MRLFSPLTAAAEKPRILVVEDEAATQFILMHFLEEHGFAVLSASCAAEAMTLLETSPAVAAVFTDVRLPDMNGHALAQSIRRAYPDMPIILGSGSGLAPALATGESYSFFMKPYDFPQIARHIHGLVSRAA
jgi:DNA-binding NtrC family response regulator